MSTVPPQVEDAELWDKAIYEITGKYDYFETHWRKYLPGLAGDVIHAMWKVTRFDTKHKRRQVEDIVPRHAKIAEMAHVSLATVRRVLHTTDGRFTYSYYGRPVGPHIHRWINGLDKRWRVDQATHAVWQTSNHYQMSSLMPPVPEHDELVRQKYDELKAEREKRAQEAASIGIYKNDTHVAVSRSDSCSALNLGDQVKQKTTMIADEGFDHLERDVGVSAIRRNHAGQQATPRGVEDRNSNEIAQPGKDTPQSNQINSQPDKDAAAPAAPRRRPETEDERGACDDAQWVLADKLAQAGAALPKGAADALVREMIDEDVPYALMVRLVRHAYRKSNKDGRNIHNRAGHYVTTTRNLMAEARKKRWDLDAIIAADEARWQPTEQTATSAFPQARTHNRAGRNGSGYDLYKLGR